MEKPRNKFITFYISTAIVVFNVLLILGLLEGGLGIIISIRDSRTNKSTSVPVEASYPVYANMPDRNALWLDVAKYQSDWATFEPYVHWLTKSMNLKYIHVDDNGYRKTVKKSVPNAKKVFLFGGSTMFCAQSPDGGTIASQLQEMLGDGYDVWNLGQGAYVSTQEVFLLCKLIAEGTIPDYVVFYDGVNDTFSGVYSPAIPRDPQNIRLQRKREAAERAEDDKPMTPLKQLESVYHHSNFKRFLDWITYKLQREGKHFVGGQDVAGWEESIKVNMSENAVQTVQYYEANISIVKALGKAYGFSCSFFWQPTLFTLDRPLLPYEQDILNSTTKVFREVYQDSYKVAESRLADRENENIYYEADMFNKSDLPVYVDFCHVGPEGNHIIAERIYKKVFSGGQ